MQAEECVVFAAMWLQGMSLRTIGNALGGSACTISDLPGVFRAKSYLRTAPRLVDVACC